VLLYFSDTIPSGSLTVILTEFIRIISLGFYFIKSFLVKGMLNFLAFFSLNLMHISKLKDFSSSGLYG